jgi:tetratricopeptide (TPR) repeat protein
VITKNGEVYELDDSDLGEYSADDDGPDIYGDVMSLRGPLPAVELGAIIEEFHVVKDLQPEFAAGVIRSFYFTRDIPIQNVRIVIEADDEIPLETVVHRFDAAVPVVENIDGVFRLTLDTGILEAWESDAWNAPGTVAREPVIRFSTGSSWKAVATAYAEIVDAQIATSDIEADVREIVGKATDRDEILDLLLAYLRKNVRYTGIEFGDQSLIPSTPAETLERRFGDCKDKSTLLVAMLRSLGFKANVALLRTGTSNDVDPALPGVGRFNHAIVHLPGTPEVWIDPTSRFARAGELPGGDRGRLALIADTATTDLHRTPDRVSSENVRKEYREVVLAHEGSAEITETSTVTGWIARSYRESFSGEAKTQLQEQLEDYVKGQYRAESLKDFEVSGVDDPTQPMTIRLVATDCRAAMTSLADAAVTIQLGALVRDLPGSLRPDEDEEDDDEAPTPRKHPYELAKPVVVEIDYRIQPPPGYAMTTLPESTNRTLGPAVLTEDYRIDDDGVVTAELRFDTVKAVYTADEVEATKKAVGEFFAEPNPKVIYSNIGEQHLEAGRIREALEQFQSLVAMDPSEAIYRTQVARAYLAAGLGAAARREARQAAELDPESVLVYNTLGVILANDELGRKFNAGFDHEGAETAFRQAIELDPENYNAHGELAILLDYDTEGNRYTKDARMDEAITIYEQIRTDLGYENLTSNLMSTQFFAGRFSDLRELWEEAPKDATRNAFYIAATAADESAESAIAEAARITDSSEEYRSVLQAASEWLTKNRLYPESSAVLAAGSKGADDSIQLLARADLLGRIERYETIPADPTDPEGAVRGFFVALTMDSDGGVESVRHLLLPDLLADADPEVLSELIDLNRDIMTSTIRQADISDELVLDWTLSLSNMSSTEASPSGTRVRFRPAGLGSTGNLTLDFYTVPFGDEHRLVGFTLSHSMIGEMLLQRLEREETEDIPRWLNWIVEELVQFGSEDVLSRNPLQWLWPVTDGEPDLRRLQLAAASIMLDSAYGSRPIAILQSGLETEEDQDVRTGIDLALSIAGQTSEDWELSLEAAQRLTDIYPRSSTAFMMQVQSLIMLGRFDEADSVIKERLERIPGEQSTLALYCDVPQYTGDLAEYRRRMQSTIDDGRALPGVYNNMAWLDIVEQEASDTTRQTAMQAVTMTDYSEPAALHTLATVYVELGMTTEARNVMLALLANHSSNDLESPDWYILGRIAEHYGAVEAAIDAYGHVEPSEAPAPEQTSTYRLAANRITALEENLNKTAGGKE